MGYPEPDDILLEELSKVKKYLLNKCTPSKAGANVEISGGTQFYLTAPLTQAEDVSETFDTTMRGTAI